MRGAFRSNCSGLLQARRCIAAVAAENGCHGCLLAVNVWPYGMFAGPASSVQSTEKTPDPVKGGLLIGDVDAHVDLNNAGCSSEVIMDFLSADCTLDAQRPSGEGDFVQGESFWWRCGEAPTTPRELD
jgi:hypothetical protein